jgi:PAS domain S-box-containing protein
MTDAGSIDRSKIGHTLQNEVSFLNLVVENIPALVAVKDAEELRFVLLNRHGEELTGIPREESLGKNDFDFFPVDQAEEYVRADRNVLASGKLTVIEEEPITTRNKGVRYLRTLKMPVPDATGVPRYLLAMSEDITDRKHAEEALRASQAMFGGVMEASPDAVIAIDDKGTILLANERFRSMYGYGPEELIGKNAAMLTPPALAEENNRKVAEAMGGATVTGAVAPLIQDLVGLRRDGTEFPIEATLSVKQSERGIVALASIRDVTGRKSIERQLQQAQKMEAVGNLTGGLAHDFNNLLSVIIGNLDLLREDLVEGSASDGLASEALSAALRGAELTRRLLAFARRQPLQPRVTDVNGLVDGMAKIMTRTLGENMEIHLDLSPETAPVTVDPGQLEACLLNLVTNARDAMPKGGELTITTGNQKLDEDYVSLYPGVVAGDYAMIQVSDTGSGMTKDVLDKIFEPFFTTKADGKGTGLGLAMVFGFMKQSGGHINVYSEVGVGTTFRLYLPRAAGAAGNEVPAGASAIPKGKETVLAVEDNPGLRSLVVKQLTQLGYNCLEAADGPSALKVLEARPVDLLFSDVIMPGGMSGYDLGTEAKRRWPRVKVLLTSGFPEEKHNGNGGNGHTANAGSGMRLLTKPYRKEDLARVLREVFAEDP